MRTVTAFLLITGLVLGGCAGMSRDECLVADWQTIGFEDGAAGRSATNIGRHRKACAKHGVAPDKVAYDNGYEQGILNFCNFSRGRSASVNGKVADQVCPAHADYHIGYAEGLENFCTYDSGYDYGLDGRNYRRICPSNMETAFMNGYDAGLRIHSLQDQLYALESEVASVESLREQNELDQNALKQRLILDFELTVQERAQLLLDIDALREEDDNLEDQKDSLLVQIGDVHGQLRSLGVEI